MWKKLLILIASINIISCSSSSGSNTYVAPNISSNNNINVKPTKKVDEVLPPKITHTKKPTQYYEDIMIIGSNNKSITNVDKPNNLNKDFTNKDNYPYSEKLFKQNYNLTSKEEINSDGKVENDKIADMKIEPIIKPLPQAMYSNEKIINNGVSNIKSEFDYKESKKYNYIHEVNNIKKAKQEDDIKINFFEADMTQNDINNIQKYYPTVKTYIKSRNNNNDKYDSHGTHVISSFLNENQDLILSEKEKQSAKNFDISLFGSDDYDANLSVKGIVSMSYGYPNGHTEMRRFNENGLYFDRIQNKYYSDANNYFSNALHIDNYVENNQLKIRSLGNNDFINQDRYFTNAASKSYNVMSPEVQKMARNDVILAKNIISNNVKKSYSFELTDKSNSYVSTSNVSDDKNIKHWYENENPSKSGYDSKPLLLRSYTVAIEGMLDKVVDKNDKYFELLVGSSYSAPKIARIAYEVKNKYKWMSWNQVKQVILTTADKDNTGYLSNFVGWGIANKDKALKGISDLNAGLIEEEKYYLGNVDRIFENYNSKDKNYNVYFWADIPKDTESVFENDITSGLTGDGNNKSYTLYEVKGKPTSVKDKDTYKYTMKIPKVLDSERNYYANVKQAGLRKAGEGTLTLTGKQLYKTNTQVLEGTLNLFNDSNSHYQVFENGTLNIGDAKNTKNNKDIYILNDIQNDGNVSFNTNTSVHNYLASNTSTTNIVAGKKIEANDFIVSGKLSYNFKESTSLDEIQNAITGNKVDLQSAKFKNPFLRPLLINNKRIESIKAYTNTLKDKYVRLSELSKDKLRNIPSYDDNAGKFFDGFNNKNPFTYPIYKIGKYNPKYVSENSESIKIEKDSTLYNLLNYKADSLEQAKSELFTDIYSNIVTAELDRSNEIKNLALDNANPNVSNKATLRLTANYLTTLNNNPKYSNLNSTLNGYLASASVKVDNNINLNATAGYFKGTGSITDKLDNKSDYNTNTGFVGVGANVNYKNIMANANFIANYNNTNGTRNMQNNRLDYNLSSFNFITNLGLAYNLKVNDKLIITPELNYTNMIYKIHKFSENTNALNKPYTTDISNNTISKHNINTGVKLNYDTKFLSYFGKAKLDVDLNPINNLKTKVMDVEYNAKVESLYKYKGIFELGAKKQIDNHSFEIKTILDTKLKGGVSASYEMKF